MYKDLNNLFMDGGLAQRITQQMAIFLGGGFSQLFNFRAVCNMLTQLKAYIYLKSLNSKTDKRQFQSF